MCDHCIIWDDEADDWKSVECDCACAEEDLTAGDDGSMVCKECRHQLEPE